MSKTSEPLLTENPNRYVMFPISDSEIWSHYKNARFLLANRRNRFIQRFKTLEIFKR